MNFRKYAIPGLIAGGVALVLSWAFVNDLVNLSEILVSAIAVACWIALWQWRRQWRQRK